MKSLSKITVFLPFCFCLLVVNVQTAIQTNNPNFGDILVFPRTTCGVPLASHYAIYVDNVTIPGRQPEHNLFHMTKFLNGSSGCVFGQTRRVTFTVDNYMDNNLTQVDQQTIINRINELRNSCGHWWLSNTCEHVATHVRYGEAQRQCNQNGTLFGSLACYILNRIVNPNRAP